MANTHRRKLSSDLIVTKIICFLGFVLSVFMIIRNSQDDTVIGFKSEQWKIFLVVFIATLGYFLTRPKIYYDEINLYVKRINKTEIAIPLKDVKSFFKNPFSVSKGTATFTIEFCDSSPEQDKIKFIAQYASKSIKDFKTTIKKVNPAIEIG
jgi:hypothetical protein